MEITSNYIPHPKQKEFHQCRANEIMFGGAAGPGKSHALRHEGFDLCMRIPGLHVFLFRRTYGELELNHILPSQTEFPEGVGRYREQKKRWEFVNGSMMHFCHCQYEKDVFNYRSAEFHVLLIDELTSFTEFMYKFLRSRTRCTLEIPAEYKHKIPGISTASNPGGPGHEFVKRMWVDFAPPYMIKKAPSLEGGMHRCYIPGLLKDNPTMTVNDPEYEHRLNALPEPFRSAYRDGDWNLFLGQAFHFTPEQHVIEPIPVPSHVPIYMTFDWGFGAPFSIGWWWVDAEDTLYRFAEWYGWNKNANEGLRLTDPLIAHGIMEREEAMGIKRDRHVTRLCDPTCFNKKPDYKGGGQGPSTVEEFMSATAGRLCMHPGDANRKLKIRQFRERLRVPLPNITTEAGKLGFKQQLETELWVDEKYNEYNRLEIEHLIEESGVEIVRERAKVQIYSTCEQFIRTIPMIQTDDKNVEDIASTGEDHVYDESCHVMMARPMMGKKDKVDDYKPPTTVSDIAWMEQKEIWEEAQEDSEDYY